MSNFFYKIPDFKRFSSILLLFVFTLGITPKKTLHTWFANHADSTSTIPHGKTKQLSKAGFNCQCDNLVVESHFINPDNILLIQRPLIYSFFSAFIQPLISFSVFHNNHRGPPLQF